MEELKLLLEMVKDLPSAAIYVLGGYLFYKLVIVGSIYKTLTFVCGKLFDTVTILKKKRLEQSELDSLISESAKIHSRFDAICISAYTADLVDVILMARDRNGKTSYLRQADVEWIKSAIKEKISRDNRKPNE